MVTPILLLDHLWSPMHLKIIFQTCKETSWHCMKRFSCALRVWSEDISWEHSEMSGGAIVLEKWAWCCHRGIYRLSWAISNEYYRKTLPLIITLVSRFLLGLLIKKRFWLGSSFLRRFWKLTENLYVPVLVKKKGLYHVHKVSKK